MRIGESAHISQSVADILTTPLGSRVQRRDYGSLIPELIDAPVVKDTIVLLYAATATALMRWEPRVRWTRVTMGAGSDGQVSIAVEGNMRRGGERFNVMTMVSRSQA